MSAGLLLDTDVLIDYLRGLPDAVAYLESLETPLFISAITIGELYSGVREGHERTALAAFLISFEIIPIDDDVAKRGGLLCRDYRKSHGVGLADAIIAASAEIHDLTIVTMNRKHFPMSAKINIPYRKI